MEASANQIGLAIYVARVDTFSLCSESAARWRIEVVKDGALLTSAMGRSLGTDTRANHDTGAGVLAVEFDVP